MVKIQIVSQMACSIIGDGNDAFPVSLSPDLFFATPFCRKLQNENVGCCRTVL